MKTRLDRAHAQMSKTGDDTDARINYCSVFVASELFVALTEEPGETLSPQIVEMDGQAFLLAFDTVERFGAFFDEETSYAALSGRAVVELLDHRDVGVGVNLGVSENAYLMPPALLDWIRERAVADVSEVEADVRELGHPRIDNADLLEALRERLSVYMGPDRSAYLVRSGEVGSDTHLLILVGIDEAERAPLVGALAEAVRLIAPEFQLDMVFAPLGSALRNAAQSVGLAFDMSQEIEAPPVRAAPGSDPDKPPILH